MEPVLILTICFMKDIQCSCNYLAFLLCLRSAPKFDPPGKNIPLRSEKLVFRRRTNFNHFSHQNLRTRMRLLSSCAPISRGGDVSQISWGTSPFPPQHKPPLCTMEKLILKKYTKKRTNKMIISLIIIIIIISLNKVNL